MRKTFMVLAVLITSSLMVMKISTAVQAKSPEIRSPLDFSLENIDGDMVDLSEYEGKVVMMVNVASKCGLTPQYEALQALHNKYNVKGLVVLGFPANNFRNQEPGTNSEIKKFCVSNYGVSFPMFSKISVSGKDVHPLYAYLIGEETNSAFAGDIQWNFTKFLINREGKVIARFEPRTEPDGKEIVTAIEDAIQELTPIEELGKRMFFDISLSDPAGQACSSCHGPVAGWSGPDSDFNSKGSVYEGAVKGRFGNRRPPTAAYAGDSPVLHIDEEGTFVGGMFWDGRATGEELGDPLAEQAMGPFLNKLEHNNADEKSVVELVKDSNYVNLFKKVWGPKSLDWKKDIHGTYVRIARSIAAFERSVEVSPFNSKFDDFWYNAKAKGLDVEAIDESNWKKYRKLGLEDEEVKGLMLFNTTGLCAECHVLTSVNGKPPVFTDFTYDNLGVPKNPDNPFYTMGKKWNPDGKDWVDKGLGGYLEGTEKYKKYASENYGKQKVPTLRNVDLRPSEGFVKAYTHNGFFKTLKEVVNFYNTRDVEGTDWAPPEYPENVNKDELGDLGLTPEEEDSIVLFMKTLSDRI
ncbi:MAG: redoxin domain-containing protein [Candidatus Aminicenantes bacterium]|nr:MAG: redoxin domain-containing protein [Candidatus Aminicenantes bacterium]